MNKFILTLIVLLSSKFSVANVIPIETFMKKADIASIKISPDGKHLAAIVESDGNKKLSIIEIKTNQIIHTANFPHKKQEIGDYGWFNNNRIYATMVYKVGPLAAPRDSGYMYAVNIDGKKKIQLLPSKARKNDKSYRGYSLLSFLPSDGDHILISEPDYSYSVAYKLNVNTGRKKRIAKSPEKYSSLSADNNGNVRVAQSRDKLGKKVKIHLKNSQNEWYLFKEFDAKSIDLSILDFSKDNKNLIIELNNEEYKRGIYNLDLTSKEINLIVELNNDVDIESLIYDLDFNNPEAIGIVQMKGYRSFKFFDDKHEVAKIYRSLHNAFKDEVLSIVNYSQDKSKAVVRVWSDKNPGSYYMFDLKSYKLEFMFDTYPWVDRKQMANMKPVSYTARDGLEIRGYLTLPNNKSKNLPMILMVHGGPYGPKDEWQYNREAQLFASRGYAVFQVNYRGSGGRGSDFIYDAYKQMGKEMQDDLTDATLWAVEQGYADKGRLCIYGASYGGYAALMGVAKEPDLYKCSVGYVGLYDIDLWKKSDTWRSKSGKRFVDEAWGIDDKEFVKERSPINHVNKIKAAVMLVHGKDDPRVPVENFYNIQKEFDKIGKKYESILKLYEGHGFYDFDNTVDLYTQMLKFFDKHIGLKTTP